MRLVWTTFLCFFPAIFRERAFGSLAGSVEMRILSFGAFLGFGQWWFLSLSRALVGSGESGTGRGAGGLGGLRKSRLGFRRAKRAILGLKHSLVVNVCLLLVLEKWGWDIDIPGS